MTISKELCDISVAATLETGLMDYMHIGECHSRIRIEVWSSADTRLAIEGRQLWGILESEKILWSSVEELISKFEASPNMRFDRAVSIHEEWDGQDPEPHYSLQLPDLA